MASKTSKSSFSAMPFSLALLISLVAASIIHSCAAQTIEASYQILPFAVKLIVDDTRLDMDAFQSRFEGILELHLSNYYFTALPTMSSGTELLSREAFDKVLVRSRLVKTYLGVRGGQSRIEAAVNGAALFQFSTFNVNEIPLANSTLALSTMTTLTLQAFQGNQYLELLSLYTDDDILRKVLDIEISVENTLIAGGGLAPPSAYVIDNGNANDKNTAGIAVGFTLSLLVCMAVVVALLVRQKRARRSRGKSASAAVNEQSSTGAVAPASAAATDRSTAAGKDKTDVYLDEWTKSITSIPVREGDKMVKPRPLPRPATRQSRKVWLFCIAEEDDVLEGEPRDLSLSQSSEHAKEIDGSGGDEEEKTGLVPTTTTTTTSSSTITDAASPSGRNDLHQFEDVDLAGPQDYESRVVNSSMVYL